MTRGVFGVSGFCRDMQIEHSALCKIDCLVLTLMGTCYAGGISFTQVFLIYNEESFEYCTTYPYTKMDPPQKCLLTGKKNYYCDLGGACLGRAR